MESVVNKLRSNKYLKENAGNILPSKDSSKRLADLVLDVTSKKRILGDITNKAQITKTKSLKLSSSKKETKGKASLTSVNSFENEKLDKEITSSQSSKGSNSDESLMYVTAVELNDSSFSPMDVSVIKDVESTSPTVPLGIEDFDSTCKDDPFSVSDYVVDIFNYYKEREKLFPVSKYLDKQTDVTRSMRAILVDWMVEVQESFELNHETLYLAVKLVDIYLMHNIVTKAKLQLIGATAVFVAAKFDERLPPLVDDFLYICDDSYSRSEILQTEILILKTVDFDLGIPVSYRFLRRYARCAKVSMDLLTLARYILETSLMDYDLIDVLESKIAAAALLLALRMKNQNWNATLEYFSGYKACELLGLMVQLNKNISTPKNQHLLTIRTKYSHSIFFEVANVPPLKFKNSLSEISV